MALCLVFFNHRQSTICIVGGRWRRNNKALYSPVINGFHTKFRGCLFYTPSATLETIALLHYTQFIVTARLKWAPVPISSLSDLSIYCTCIRERLAGAAISQHSPRVRLSRVVLAVRWSPNALPIHIVSKRIRLISYFQRLNVVVIYLKDRLPAILGKTTPRTR